MGFSPLQILEITIMGNEDNPKIKIRQNSSDVEKTVDFENKQ